MKIAVQADYYIKLYGLDAGLKHVKKLGYDCIDYSITDRYDAPFTTQWTDKELEEAYAPIGKAIRENGLKLVRVYQDNEMYNLLSPHTYDLRKKMYLHSLRAAAYMGAERFCVKPATTNQTHLEAREFTQKITFEVFSLLKEEADRLGIALGVVNNYRRAGEVPYGCSPEDLLEICNEFDALAVIDPSNAYRSWYRFGDYMPLLKEKLSALLMTDLENTVKNPFLPMFGSACYEGILRDVKGLGDHVHAVTMATPIFNRYADFKDVEGVNQAVDELLFKTTELVIKSANEA